MKQSRTLRFDSPLLSGVELPVIEVRGPTDGPRVCLLAGIHGCEYSSIEALTRFMRRLDPGELDRKSTRLNSSHVSLSRMPSSA